MHIALTADPELPVPPGLYGGIERMIFALATGLVERGHQVRLFANRDSKVPCALHPYPADRSRGGLAVLRNTWHVSAGVLGKGVDIVHSFGRLAYIAPLLPVGVPVLMSYQRPITASRVKWAIRLSGGKIGFAGCSRYHMMAPAAENGKWFLVYDGVSESSYRFEPRIAADAPLIFLGRIERIKGPHLAIEVARQTGRRLWLAGNVPSAKEHQEYFATHIRPFIDGDRVRYLGPVDDRAKNELLGAGFALLMPVLWEELFGIVMAEALACGLPIIGLNRGAVPEIVQQGVNGFVCDSVEEMIAAVHRIPSIDRRACRQIMEERFSDRVMVDKYEALYLRLVDAGRSDGSRRES
ncbi:MAG: hypothetical protein A3H96_00325 [Acidobacteria bacterium RIFCSPLOWO2_02_FULL_67_36]|nr:MAG: hypothetical protein A3H96_00325 [Acidobacteria bacterium RIFCSPLOWO2_02_FULL_67_36]OFW23137.1 MAG: hypothetical protein A3G21_01025 [Acidobacteria bacterium RIFCSPLOWO2_12_FULL_66_21]